jgi:hypothetical protein
VLPSLTSQSLPARVAQIYFLMCASELFVMNERRISAASATDDFALDDPHLN